MYDIGQGSCTSPILWALINQLLLVTLGEKFTSICLVEIDSVEEHIHPGDSFVDYTTTGTTNDDPELEPISTDQVKLTTFKEALIANMEEIIQFFLDLLQATRGDLAPENTCGISSATDGRTTSQDYYKSTTTTTESRLSRDQLTRYWA
jgi:hypothetical protein